MRYLVCLLAVMTFAGCGVLGINSAKKTEQPVAAVQQPQSPRPSAPPRQRQQQPRKSEADMHAEKCRLTVLSPAVYDSMLVAWQEYNVGKSYDDFFVQFVDIDTTYPMVGELPDSVYEARMRRLVSPINLTYNNIVKSYIISWTGRNKGTVSRILGLSQVYFPMIEQELARQGLPLELRMLPVIESALNPTAVSRVGATGMWQFMLPTGRSYGLEVTSMVDDRRDPVLATRAAASHLKDLYKMYGDWTLAIAAYNCGAGNVNKAIARAGGSASTFWDIYPHLPRETRGYLPSFIGANYAYAYHKQHGIDLTPPPVPICTDTVTVSRLTHFGQISSALEIPVEVVRTLNPQYIEDVIPAVERTYSLRLPQPEVSRYIEREAEIHAQDSVYLAKYLDRPKLLTEAAETSSARSYTVKKGDVLGVIARRHGVTVSQLVKWNKLKNANAIRPGQKLQILK